MPRVMMISSLGLAIGVVPGALVYRLVSASDAPVTAQQTNELLRDEAVVANLDGVTQRATLVGFRVSAAFEAAVMPAAEDCGLPGGAWKKLKEVFEQAGVEGEAWWKLPEDGAKFGSEEKRAGSEEVCERLLGVAQAQHVGDVPRALDAEDEIVRRCNSPAGEAGGTLQAVKGAIDFDGREVAGGIGEFFGVGQLGRIEDAAPRRVVPARDADPDASHGEVRRGHGG